MNVQRQVSKDKSYIRRISLHYLLQHPVKLPAVGTLKVDESSDCHGCVGWTSRHCIGQVAGAQFGFIETNLNLRLGRKNLQKRLILLHPRLRLKINLQSQSAFVR